jgi:geranylgeranyl diphosphate synthase type II
MQSPDRLRALVEEHLAGLELSPSLGGLEEAVRYSLDGGGKRIRPVLCLATTEAAGGRPEDALDAACALELIHSFSLVHDDLPALDDDEERRGRPTVHVRFGEAQAILAGDALMAEAFRLASRYPEELRLELLEATAGMIGGQYLDIEAGAVDRLELNRLKTGRLFDASVGCALWVAGVPPGSQPAWRAFGAQFGRLFQVVDDLLDGDGLVEERGRETTLALSEETEAAARADLGELDADTTALAELVGELTARQQSSV